MIKRRIVVLMVMAVMLLVANAWADEEREQEGRFEFALIGDVPYQSEDFWKFDNVIKSINADDNLQWTLHAGDIKTGSSPCSDALLMDRLQRFSQFEKPFIYTPGDNEWTDCHRVGAGEYQPLERLARLRALFFPQPGVTLGQSTMRVQTQAAEPGFEEFVENLRWQEHGVMFVSLHMVGSNNGLAAFDPRSSAQRTGADDAEVARRVRASVAWVRESYALAKSSGAVGILFLFQADPRFDLERGVAAREGFDEILDALEFGAVEFARPVVFAHGDSHYFRVDKPLIGQSSGRLIENVTRVETFGSRNVHWIRVVVEPNTAQVFSFVQEIVDENRVLH